MAIEPATLWVLLEKSNIVTAKCILRNCLLTTEKNSHYEILTESTFFLIEHASDTKCQEIYCEQSNFLPASVWGKFYLFMNNKYEQTGNPVESLRWCLQGESSRKTHCQLARLLFINPVNTIPFERHLFIFHLLNPLISTPDKEINVIYQKVQYWLQYRDWFALTPVCNSIPSYEEKFMAHFHPNRNAPGKSGFTGIFVDVTDCLILQGTFEKDAL